MIITSIQISYAGPENAYPIPLDRRFCVPQTRKQNNNSKLFIQKKLIKKFKFQLKD